ncbi:MAG TPA: hypothetical protein VJ462_04195, partial [Thermodesulfobacteriota bacterium]|nr:hypothetical protein [Thermodesulfobacteriota bacterium]
MELKEPLIRTGHPAHPSGDKKIRLLPSRIFKATLFLVIFLLSFHLPPINFESRNRQETIKEIFTVLERHPTGLANVTKEELAEVIY